MRVLKLKTHFLASGNVYVNLAESVLFCKFTFFSVQTTDSFQQQEGFSKNYLAILLQRPAAAVRLAKMLISKK